MERSQPGRNFKILSRHLSDGIAENLWKAVSCRSKIKMSDWQNKLVLLYTINYIFMYIEFNLFYGL